MIYTSRDLSKEQTNVHSLRSQRFSSGRRRRGKTGWCDVYIDSETPLFLVGESLTMAQ
jgi:hypothetical protein